MSTSPLTPNSPLRPEIEVYSPGINKNEDTQVQKVVKPRFCQIRKAATCLKTGMMNNQFRINKLAIFLAVYPIVKIAIAIATGAAISLPPVALGLFIAAATLFLLSTIFWSLVNFKTSSKVDMTKFVLESLIKFAVAPATAIHIIGKEIKESVQACVEKRRQQKLQRELDCPSFI